MGLKETDKGNIKTILDFWYGAEEQPGWDRNSVATGGWTKKWFAGGPEVDKMI